MKLASQRYGKSRVRVLKVLRDGDIHTVKELTCRVLLEGAFDAAYTAADNSRVVATDTVKNTVNVLAHEHLGAENEPFARRLASHFLDRYDHVSRVTVELDERVWSRMRPDATPHPHSFVQRDVARPFARLSSTREASALESGVADLRILKSTGSGFERFHRDDLTTLPDTSDRILATSMRATWLWRSEPKSYAAAAAAIVDALLAPFATRYSPSVQATLFEMGTAALEVCPEIERVTLAMPNLHCFPIDLTRFGRENRSEVFVPTDEPHGDIEATVGRD